MIHNLLHEIQFQHNFVIVTLTGIIYKYLFLIILLSLLGGLLFWII